MIANLGERERLLSIWVRDRLHERDAVDWAVKTLREVRDGRGADLVALFGELQRYAEKASDSEETRRLWSLLHVVAQESLHEEGFIVVYQIREKIVEGTVRHEDVVKLVDLLRPRLAANDPSSWFADRMKDERNPLLWVRWDFETCLDTNTLDVARLTRGELSSLQVATLQTLLDYAGRSLDDAIRLAKEIGWFDEDRDVPNIRVHRVFVSTSEKISETRATNDDDDDDARDPDAHNDSFAPIVRLMSQSFDVLAEKSSAAAERIASNWATKPGGLFQRLYAVAAWNPKIIPAPRVEAFFEQMDDYAFWRWITFPEIASLRALRWDELSAEKREAIALRLLNGPPRSGSFENDEEDALHFHRDHELARLVDNQRSVPSTFADIVSARRRRDAEFPKNIPAIETGLPLARVSWVRDGDPTAFNAIPDDQLLDALASKVGEREFGRGSNAEAFARTSEGRRRILEVLKKVSPDQQTSGSWKMLLTFPHQVEIDGIVSKQFVESIASLALALPNSIFAEIADALAYWLDAVEEKVPRFSGSDELWVRLLPLLEHVANQRQAESAGETERDLSSAALNEPFGHLLSMFVRRFPTIRSGAGDIPEFPVKFIELLKTVSGRARELLANRVVIQMSYFSLVDEAWLADLVIEPMMRADVESDRLWEAFAKYGRRVPSKIWETMQPYTFGRLSSASNSPDAKRHLAELCVMIWIGSKDPKSHYVFDPAGFRNALSLANDDVRGATAWQFASLFSGEDAANLWMKFGKAFFEEVWPLEPVLQSPMSANDFARIPSRVGQKYFSDAVSILIPFLLPFQVWDVLTAFNLDIEKSEVRETILREPESVLMLLAACVSPDQRNAVFRLDGVLREILAAKPDLETDHRMRFLRRKAAN